MAVDDDLDLSFLLEPMPRPAPDGAARAARTWRRRRRLRAGAGAALMLVAGVVVAGGLLVARSDDMPRRVRTASPDASAPSGWEQVSFRAVRFAVPPLWPIVDLAHEANRCYTFGEPAAYVGAMSDARSCPPPPEPARVADTVWAQPLRGALPEVRQRITVNGIDGYVNRANGVVAWFPALDTMFTFTGDRDTADKILATVHRATSDVDVDSIGTAAGGVGWVVSRDGRLALTHDDGGTWRTVTPPAAAKVAAAAFVDGDLGWAASTSADGPVVYRTTDGGEHWDEATVPPPGDATRLLGPARLEFVDQDHGWLTVQIEGTANANSTALWATRDGGITWSALEIPYQGDVQWDSPTVGWLAGRGTDQAQASITTDAGKTWTPIDTGGRSVHTVAHGVLAVLDGDAVEFLRVEPTGPTREIATMSARNAQLIDFVDDDTWILVMVTGQPLITEDAARTWTPGASRQHRFYDGDVNARIAFRSSLSGWVLHEYVSCPDKKDCATYPVVEATDDGGQSWRVLQPPL
jgi:photosystem II stability/assembly factor-like uncharacterized protein